MNTIKELAKQIHQNAVNKGFYDETQSKNIGEKLMLIVSELSEALEADRCRKRTLPNVNLLNHSDEDEHFVPFFLENVKDTFEDELADALIRILDLAEWQGIDIQSHVIAKMRYNATRQKYHGKAY